jgi:lysophospholipase
MCNDQTLGYSPKAGYLHQRLLENPMFHDTKFDYKNQERNLEDLPTALVMPPSIFGKRTTFTILEYTPLLDSSNMTIQDWIHIAGDIEKYYHDFDAFIVLHGTDTMSYTASALSFMLENLGKTVIITGSQIPLSELRNDAASNLLGALTLAGHYVIPEVTIFFGNCLYRGNRTVKTNLSTFDAFDSPNMKPLATVGINIGTTFEYRAVLSLLLRNRLAGYMEIIQS